MDTNKDFDDHMKHFESTLNSLYIHKAPFDPNIELFMQLREHPDHRKIEDFWNKLGIKIYRWRKIAEQLERLASVLLSLNYFTASIHELKDALNDYPQDETRVRALLEKIIFFMNHALHECKQYPWWERDLKVFLGLNTGIVQCMIYLSIILNLQTTPFLAQA